MKKVFSILAVVLLTATVWAKSPEKMSYQPVIRNSSDATGKTQLISATYALYVKTAESITGEHYIGEHYGGGIIFWLDTSKQHGLIASTADQSTGIYWSKTFTTIGTTLDAVYAGKTNTNLIIANQGKGSYAAQICADYSITVNNEHYDDWYLPSKYELNLLFQQKAAVGGFDIAFYWSSTELDTDYHYAWLQYLYDGEYSFHSKTTRAHVRAIRAF